MWDAFRWLIWFVCCSTEDWMRELCVLCRCSSRGVYPQPGSLEAIHSLVEFVLSPLSFSPLPRCVCVCVCALTIHPTCQTSLNDSFLFYFPSGTYHVWYLCTYLCLYFHPGLWTPWGRWLSFCSILSWLHVHKSVWLYYLYLTFSIPRVWRALHNTDRYTSFSFITLYYFTVLALTDEHLVLF